MDRSARVSAAGKGEWILWSNTDLAAACKEDAMQHAMVPFIQWLGRHERDQVRENRISALWQTVVRLLPRVPVACSSAGE